MKKRISLSGRLLFPLKEGQCAVIQRGGDVIRTSRVVEILEVTDISVRFETMNTVYLVSTAPVPSVAAAPMELRMCA
ncbi:Uncharacterised protein [uncultured Ruminococcus sp.]|uniref:Uncharacterized protein n=1 Tax=Hydrogeniiclostridium mannosilyticum TaxID=2764322 RepID=A0A328UBF2_9FIRM|nr:hypothetical protein [Hydrogeniiclostridium mannosilyticum]RAQ28679.1 hypothetical protein DPQ25_07735 [Hydrogeniiclostridium mannosilyticum]SCH34715.1 Uncharacterised protein [uncultured Ruminococcus sp.]